MNETRKKRRLCLICGAAALLLVECGHFGAGAFLFPLLAMLVLVPVSEECKLLPGLCVYAAAALLSLLLPLCESSAIFVLLGFYPILRPRIEALGIRSLRMGVRILVIVVSATLLFVLIRFFYGPELQEIAGTSDSILLIVFIAASAVYFLLYEFILDRSVKFYRETLHKKFDAL